MIKKYCDFCGKCVKKFTGTFSYDTLKHYDIEKRLCKKCVKQIIKFHNQEIKKT